jgi:hypothetical protein
MTDDGGRASAIGSTSQAIPDPIWPIPNPRTKVARTPVTRNESTSSFVYIQASIDFITDHSLVEEDDE